MTTTNRRWLGVGRSEDQASRAAGRSAADAAIAGDDPKLLVVFCSDSHDLSELLAGIGERAPGVPLIGCSTAGQIATDGPGDGGVVIAALGGEGFSVTTAAASTAGGRQRDAGAEVAAAMPTGDGAPHRVMLMLSDALGGDQQEVIRGAYSVLGAEVPLVGGCAGDDFRFEATFQLHGTEVLRDSVVAAALTSDSAFGIGVRHGWQRIGEPVMVTRSEGNKVYELDDRPALDVYLERHDAPEAATRDADAFNLFAMTRPLGLARRSTEESVRMVAGANFEERSLNTIAAVPQGGLAWFMHGGESSVLDATDDACSAALASVNGTPLLGMLAFDCAARRGVLGDDGIAGEVQRVAGHADGTPVAGFYSYGEIARTSGMTGFHNQTLVVLAVT
jgi:hypothetical protein